MASVTTLLLPGIDNSGPDHWQTLWEQRNPSFHRVLQDDWHTPRCSDWVTRLSKTLAPLNPPVVLVAHSSACALVAHWSVQAAPAELAKVQGALLVAPSDPEGPAYPVGPTGFAPMPLLALPFRSIVVASTNDPYLPLQRAKEYVLAWHSRLVVIRDAGHINSASGLGEWTEGYALLQDLQR